MKRLLVAVALLSLFSLPAFAQDTSMFEVFGGYDYYSPEDAELLVVNFHGLIGAAEFNVNSNFGVVAELGWNRDSYEDIYTLNNLSYLFGPRFSYRTEDYRIFAHYLLGGNRTSESVSDESESNYAQAIGGGVDIVVNNVVSIRPAQIDFLSVRTNFEGMEASWDNGFRYSGGIVFKF